MSPEPTVALVIIAKVPRAAECKTRLVPPLSYEQAARLSKCFLADTADNVRDVAARCAATPAVLLLGNACLEERVALFGDGMSYIEQRGATFGERIASGVADFLSVGHLGVSIIDSDSPTLPACALEATVAALNAPGDRVVLGPANDGGYYLIGLKHLHPELFERIDWSTERVFAQTVDRARTVGLEIITLEHWYDVDDARSLQTLRDEFRTGLPAGGYAASRTRRYVSSHIDRSLEVMTA